MKIGALVYSALAVALLVLMVMRTEYQPASPSLPQVEQTDNSSSGDDVSSVDQSSAVDQESESEGDLKQESPATIEQSPKTSDVNVDDAQSSVGADELKDQQISPNAVSNDANETVEESSSSTIDKKQEFKVIDAPIDEEKASESSTDTDEAAETKKKDQ